MGRAVDRWQGGDVRCYSLNVGARPFWHDLEASRSLALFLAQRGIAPFYYYCQEGSPYPIPWKFKSETEADYDLSLFEEAAGMLVREHGIRHVFIGSEWRTGWGNPGFTMDGGRGWPTTMSARNQDPTGQRILKSFVSRLGSLLEDAGLAPQVCMYITDEPHARVEALTAERAAIVKKGLPQARTFAAGYGRGRWRDYFEYCDIFTGKFSEENERRFREKGGEYWEPYNRPMFIGAPLAVARVVGLDCWRRGYPSYFHYASQSVSDDPFVNSKGMQWDQLGKSASDPSPRRDALGGMWPRLTYISGVEPEGLGMFVYPWPVDEPTLEGVTRLWASSIRLEALVQSINDYEYMRLLKENVEEATYAQFLSRVDQLLDDGDLGGGTSHDVPELVIFDTNPQAFFELKADVGAAIERALKP